MNGHRATRRHSQRRAGKEPETDSEHTPEAQPAQETAGQSTESHEGITGKSALELPETIRKYPVYRYNVDESKRPGGLKVRWKVRVITGPEAAKWEARQNQAILELLKWADKHYPRT